jgi:type VI secretion system secreted protein Hcp
MATNMFLKIQTIPGESRDDAHKGEIDIYKWHLGLESAGAATSRGGLSAGRTSFQELNVGKHVDASTTGLMLACAKGTHIQEAKLTVRKAGGNRLDYMIITMRDVLVSSVRHSGSPEETEVVESITLGYAHLQVVYIGQTADGRPEAPKEFNWDPKGK